MIFFKRKIKVVTHDGNFHADDVFACATISLWAEKNNLSIEIKRTRDMEIIKKSDIVIDVGMVYDPKTRRFDHHQLNVGTHENGTPYASFGLVWKHYGFDLCESVDIAKIIERKLVYSIDARDNGINISKDINIDVPAYLLTKQMISAFRADWDEDPKNNDIYFFEILNIAKTIIKKEIKIAKSSISARDIIKDFLENQKGQQIIILDKYIPWEESVISMKEAKLVVFPDQNKNNWCIEVVRDDIEDYSTNRISFPVSWRGLRDTDLETESGVKDSIFCHKGGFFAVVKTLEAAKLLANKTLSQN